MSLKVGPETSDGWHTFAELYHYRMLYHALWVNQCAGQGLYDVHKSLRHSDGKMCFGGGWFIVVAQLPGGQIANHYELSQWHRFRIPERETSAVWDGHTSRDAADRLAALLDTEES